jgi:hypothetical protein
MTSMLTSHPRPRRSRVEQVVTLLLATCLTLLAISAGAAARATQPTATISSATLHNAIAARTAADRTLAQNIRKLNKCLRAHPRHCGSAQRAVKRSRLRLNGAQRRLSSLTARVSRTHTTTTTQAPVLTVSGQTLTWSAVGGVSSYAFVRKVPGQPDQYSIITGTSITPPAVAGTTVRYSIRTNVTGSLWAPEVTISYPATTTTTPPATTSLETTTPVTTSPTEPVPSSGGFVMGVVAGAELTYERPFIEKLGAHTARMEFKINTSASQMASTIEAYAKAGIQPLLLASFYGRLPSPEESRNLASWAAEFGPGGSLWQGKTFPANTAVTHIEFGNETSYTYQFSNNSTTEYASRAQTYAVRVKEAAEAVKASNPGVGILAQADSGGLSGNAWVTNMFTAVPNLGALVGGWSVHPYGSAWQTRLDQLLAGTTTAGASSSIPIYVTEWGLDTDNGRCLEYNYGWNKCMTYEEAASTLSSSVTAMRSRYGSRLAAVYLYQAHDQQPTGTSISLESYFGAVQSNGSPKGAYTTEVKSLLSSNP